MCDVSTRCSGPSCRHWALLLPNAPSKRMPDPPSVGRAWQTSGCDTAPLWLGDILSLFPVCLCYSSLDVLRQCGVASASWSIKHIRIQSHSVYTELNESSLARVSIRFHKEAETFVVQLQCVREKCTSVRVLMNVLLEKQMLCEGHSGQLASRQRCQEKKTQSMLIGGKCYSGSQELTLHKQWT